MSLHAAELSRTSIYEYLPGRTTVPPRSGSPSAYWLHSRIHDVQACRGAGTYLASSRPTPVAPMAS